MTRSPAFLFLLVLASFHSQPASACSCEKSSLHERVDHAERIVIARVTSSTYLPSASPLSQLRVTYDVIEVLKGSADPKSGETSEPVMSPGNCAVPLFPGHQVVLFLGEGTVPNMCNGSFLYMPGNIPSERALTTLRAELAGPSKDSKSEERGTDPGGLGSSGESQN